jgi:hypothetical protein
VTILAHASSRAFRASLGHDPIIVAYGAGVDSTAMLIGLRDVIADEGLPKPLKSACFVCPASKKHEVDWLAATHPELATISIEMERRAHHRGLTTTRGLGRRWSWSEHLGAGDPKEPASPLIASAPFQSGDLRCSRPQSFDLSESPD